MITIKLAELMHEASKGRDKPLRIKDVSAGTGIHRATLSAILNPKDDRRPYNAHLDLVDAFCDYFQVPVEKVVEHTPKTKAPNLRVAS
ncbi:MAG: hypothetical protein AWU57_565 [Marinobacter sp. T13-3]|nr:MAG: hypothetical protein AWU57_565 [Marinobacter sp. T13-3]